MKKKTLLEGALKSTQGQPFAGKEKAESKRTEELIFASQWFRVERIEQNLEKRRNRKRRNWKY